MEAVSVVLVSPRNPVNIGAAGRAMANLGFGDLRLVEAYRVAAEEARGGPHAEDVLRDSRDFSTVADAVADATLVVGTTSALRRDVKLEIKRLEHAVAAMKQHEGKVAVLFGSEKFGLSNEDMGHCHWLVRIPTLADTGSMNLGQAVAVTLYEIIREAPVVEPVTFDEKLASAGMLDEFVDRLYEALQLSGYVHAENIKEKLRRLSRRMQLRERDAVMWLGMVRQILWKLKSEN
ncbi:RNA methyltransferase [Bryobacter aggregatus]|uniref:RNA methyltransferase n=1 Tax=Bryobacter aggregatus TaxID=360054 RepID=UPI000A811948|nr:TrmH family RNA methyltransferase [Bryobacter aggregatus]